MKKNNHHKNDNNDSDNSIRQSPDVLIAGTSLWQDAWRRLRKNTMAVAGGVVILALGTTCFLGPSVIAPANAAHPPTE